MRVLLDDLPEVAIDYHPGTHRWTVQADALATTLREWTWGERKRLLRASVTGGALDADQFARSFTTLLCAPPPAAELTPLATYIGLSLFAREDGRPIAAAERKAARALGLPPGALDGELVSDVEACLPDAPAVDAPPVAPPSEAGWTRLDFTPDPEDGP